MTIIQLVAPKLQLAQNSHEQQLHRYMGTIKGMPAPCPMRVSVSLESSIPSAQVSGSDYLASSSRSGTPKPRKPKRVTISKTFPFNSCNLSLLKDTSSSLNLALRHSVSRYTSPEITFNRFAVTLHEQSESMEKSYSTKVVDYYSKPPAFASALHTLHQVKLSVDNLALFDASSRVNYRQNRRRSLLKSLSLVSSFGSDLMSSASSVSTSYGMLPSQPMQFIRRKLEDMIRECFHHISFTDPFVQIVTNLAINSLLQDYSTKDENELFMNIIDKRNRHSILETLEDTFLFSYVNHKLFSLYDNFINQLTSPPFVNKGTPQKLSVSTVKPQLFYQYYRSIWNLEPDYYSSFTPDEIRHDYLVRHQFRPKDEEGYYEELMDDYNNEAYLMTITKFFFIYGKELKQADKNLPFIRGLQLNVSEEEEEEDESGILYSGQTKTSPNDEDISSVALLYTEENRGRLCFPLHAVKSRVELKSKSLCVSDLENSSDSLDTTNISESVLSDSDLESDISDTCAISDTETTRHFGLFEEPKKILFLEDDDVLQFDKFEPSLYVFCDIHGISVDALSRN